MSKYDSYWKSRFDEVALALREVAVSGKSVAIDVSDLREHGSRNNWYGLVEIYSGYIDKGEMVHAGSLGKIIEQSGIIKELGVEGFSLVITSDLKLYAKRITLQESEGLAAARCWRSGKNNNEYNEPSQEHSGIAVQEESLDVLIEILKEIPDSSWEEVNRQEPEWKTMRPFLDKFGYGPFSVLMMITGLNDFQLKGKAEIAYWPPIKEKLDHLQNLTSPMHLSDLLEPFYRSERSNRIKINRLNRFLSSKLAERMWLASPDIISAHFNFIWYKLADVMRQEAHAKTIVFAMKCLGLSLLMAGEKRFDFSSIPIPVDYRINKFTKEAGLSSADSEDEVRVIWQKVLEKLQDHNPEINMIALDSLVWQLAGYNNEEGMKNYLARIGAKQAGEKLAVFLGSKKISRSYGDALFSTATPEKTVNNFSRQQTANDAPIFCFIPCCAKKSAKGRIVKPEKRITEAELSERWSNLIEARDAMQYCIKTGSPSTTALHLYTGMPYSVFNHLKNNLISDIQDGKIRLFIISAGYGIVDALEPINNYDAMLRDEVATMWRDNYLSEIIAELLLHHRPAKVYGFFAGKDSWSLNSSMYRYFYSTGVKIAREKGLRTEAGCFYRRDGRGVAAILGALGRSFIKLYQSGFDEDFANTAADQGIIDDNVIIGYDAFD